MRLDRLDLDLLYISLEWRNNHMESLRTPYMITDGMQEKFYEDVICNRDSPYRYWALKETRKELKEKNNLTLNDEVFVGVGGLTNISWENRKAEISLIIGDDYQRMGLGEKAVELLLDQAFNYLNLQNVYGEVYRCNEPGMIFWKKIIKKYKAKEVMLPDRKYYDGQYWLSLYFTINKEMSG